MLKIEIDPRYPAEALEECAMVLALLRDVLASTGGDGLDLSDEGAAALVGLFAGMAGALRQVGAMLPADPASARAA